MTDKQVQAPLSEPTDPRIAEIVAELESWNHEAPGTFDHKRFTGVQMQAMFDALSVAEQEAFDLNQHLTLKERELERAYALATEAEQRLEQVTAERDSWRKDCQNITDTLHEADKATAFWRDKTSELHAAKEAAEATIASLRDAMNAHRLNCKTGGPDPDAIIASLPSSAVSRTAERQP